MNRKKLMFGSGGGGVLIAGTAVNMNNSNA